MGQRRIVGVTGPPGVGKSTYAAVLLAQASREGVPAAVVPMDGFHLADATLAGLGLLDRKGAPETFDAWGYAALLRRLRSGARDHPVYAPGFERTLEQPLAAAVVVAPEVDLVLTEGNYLLLEEPGWVAARACLDEVVWLDVDPDVRRERLVARHVLFGKTPTQAAGWVARVDAANAARVLAVRERADRWVQVD